MLAKQPLRIDRAFMGSVVLKLAARRQLIRCSGGTGAVLNPPGGRLRAELF